MRVGHSRDSLACADFALGLAITGMRKGEANTLEWRDLDFKASEIVVRGDAVFGTKGGEGWRRVPMIPDARTLFEPLRAERAQEPLNAKVFQIRECQKSLDRACKKVGADRITHHDLQHTAQVPVGFHEESAAVLEEIHTVFTRCLRCDGIYRFL